MVFHFPPMSGGGVIVVASIVNTLAKLGHKITVITPDVEWNGQKYEPKINSNINVIRVPVPSSKNIKIAARRCQKNIKNCGIEEGHKQKFDFVFSIFHPFQLVPKAAVSCAKELEIPSIIKIDDAVYGKSTGLKSIQRKIEKRINSKTLQNSSKILVSNQSSRELVCNYYNVHEKNVSIVPNGVELERFSKKSILDKKKIVFTGVMYFHRGLDILLEAVPKIIQKNPDVEFILIGEGPELEKLKILVKKMRIESNIAFKGWLSFDEIPKILAQCSIGIGPLRSTPVTKDALPIKVLEYMAASLPIISAYDTLPSNILENGKNGYFVHDSDDLAEKIIAMLEDKVKMNEYGKNSKSMVTKFDWNIICDQIINEYEKIKN